MGKRIVTLGIWIAISIGVSTYTLALQPLPKGVPTKETNPDSATIARIEQGAIPKEILDQKKQFEKERLNVLRKRKLTVPTGPKREYGIRILSKVDVETVEKSLTKRRDYFYVIISCSAVVIGLVTILILLRRK